MRKDVIEILKQYKDEILKFDELEKDTFGFYVEDWWHFLDDVAINAHDYGDTGQIHINLYDWFEDVGTVDMVDSCSFTIEEFKNL
jgi:hypothetical protein